jgi:hypothetical protein
MHSSRQKSDNTTNPTSGFKLLTYRCTHVSPTVDTLPAFATPVFQTNSLVGYFTQRVCEFTDALAGFDLVDADGEELIPVIKERLAAAGDPVLFAILQKDGLVALGTKADLKHILTGFVSDVSAPLGFRVQAAEIIGDRVSSKALRRGIGTDTGPQSADISRTYHRSFAQTLFWQSLFDAAKDRTAVERLLPLLPLTTVELTQSGTVLLNADAIDPLDFPQLDLKKIAASIEVELGISIPSNDDDEPDYQKGSDQLFDIFVEINEDNVRSFVNEVLGKDGRVTSISYHRATGLIRELGFRDLNQVRKAIEGLNSRYLAHIAWGTAQGSVTRLELCLLAAMGEKFIDRHPWERHWSGFRENRTKLLTKFGEHGVKTGYFDPLAD